MFTARRRQQQQPLICTASDAAARVPALHEALATAEGAQAALRAELADHPELFQKPKTWTLHGIKIGFRKGSGKVEWEIEDEQLVAKIKKRFGTDSEQVRSCIRVIEKIDSDALRDLEAKDLAALGVTIEDVVDVPFIKAETSEADKLVKRLLKEATGRIPDDV